MSRSLPKLLLIFRLEGTLCKTKGSEVATLTKDQVSRHIDTRANLDDFLRFLFVRNRLFFKVAVWESSSKELTETLSKKVFSTLEHNILFKYSSPDQQEQIDLKRVWYNYNDFSESNTVYIDAEANTVVQTKNLITFPKFADDNCLKIFQDYLKFFSYQYQDKRFNTFQEFIGRIPFPIFFFEHSKVAGAVPKGEAERFW